MSTPQPAPFFELRVHRPADECGVTGMCIGYERRIWRADQVADHLMEWLPEFALTATELESISHANAVQMIRRAARIVYESKKFERRGEFGELILHAIVRQAFNSLPAISKIFYKSARNDTVKGFDAVHVVGPPDNMELWLGEAKFYDDFSRAVRDVVAEIKAHLETDFLRDEFLLISNKIDDAWPHAPQLRRLLHENTSLDQVFKRVCIPILLTYDSGTIRKHREVDEAYVTSFTREIDDYREYFAERCGTLAVRVHLFLFPLEAKTALVRALDERLKRWQQL